MSKIKEYFLNNFVIKNDKLGTILLDLSYFLLVVTLVTLPLFTTRSGFTTITLVLSLATGLSIFAYIFFRGKLFFNYFVVLFAVFVIYAAIVTLIGSKSFSTLKSIITLYALGIAIFQLCANTKNVHIIGIALLTGLLLFTGVFLVKFLPIAIKSLKSKEQLARLGEEFGNLNYVGRNFALGSILCTCIACYKKKYYLFFLAGSLLCGVCTILTGSRGAYLMLGVGTLVPFFFIFPKKFRWIYLVAIVATVLVFIGVLQLPALKSLKDAMERAFNTITNTGRGETSTARRIQMFQDALYLWSKKAIFGYGAYGFASASSFGTYSHNSITEMLCDFGVVGFAIFYTPIVLLLANLDKTRSKDNLYYISVTISIIVAFLLAGSFFFVLYQDKILIITLSVLFAYDFKLNSEEERWLSFSFLEKGVQKRVELNRIVASK